MLKTFVLLSIFEETVILFSGFIDDGFIKQWQNVDFGDYPFLDIRIVKCYVS